MRDGGGRSRPTSVSPPYAGDLEVFEETGEGRSDGFGEEGDKNRLGRVLEERPVLQELRGGFADCWGGAFMSDHLALDEPFVAISAKDEVLRVLGSRGGKATRMRPLTVVMYWLLMVAVLEELTPGYVRPVVTGAFGAELLERLAGCLGADERLGRKRCIEGPEFHLENALVIVPASYPGWWPDLSQAVPPSLEDDETGRPSSPAALIAAISIASVEVLLVSG